MKEKTQKNRLFTISNAFIVVAGVMIASEPMAHAYQVSQGVRADHKCELQLPAILKEQDLPGDGASHYNPWIRECSYAYYDYKLKDVAMNENDKYKTYHWSLLFN